MFGLIPSNRKENNIFRYMDELEKNFFNNTISGDTGFRCDISEKKDKYLLEAELPGFMKDDINVNVDGDTLTITAIQSSDEGEKDKDGNYIRRERRYGHFSRSFDISGIEADKIKAEYKNGILELELPKSAEKELPEARRIEIAG